MNDDAAQAELAELLDLTQNHIRNLGQASARIAQLTASASSADQRVTVTVNATGVLIKTAFASDIGDLTFDEIAKLMTSTTQKAAAAVEQKKQELLSPLTAARSQLPSLSDLVAGMPDLRELSKDPVPAPTTPPGAANRVSAVEDLSEQDDAPAELADAEQPDRRRDEGSGAVVWTW